MTGGEPPKFGRAAGEYRRKAAEASVAEELGVSEAMVRTKLGTLTQLLGIGDDWEPGWNSALWPGLARLAVKNASAAALVGRVMALKDALPNTDISRLAATWPALFDGETDAVDVAAVLSHARAETTGVPEEALEALAVAHPALFLCQGGGKNVVYCVKRAQTLMKAKDDRDAVDMLLSRPAAVPAVAPLVTSNAGGLGPPD